ncbi:hypothetical protein Micbo1qcDRAFT_178918 [Microdochium bolleyi]|uniref:BTB domain-containing protein n=1 Tax=Microdochium bolleyi TaxID=196109 RepID=A0A136IRR8_9PEZI|nr:hypothetical protein Micbo1qcDRAFT_178918 [Microdochium bolleyi]
MSAEGRLGPMRGLRVGDGTADCTIKCKGDEYRVHKSVLTAQGNYFANMFKEMKENFTGVIVLDHEDRESVRCLIQFFYKYKYETDVQPFQVPDGMEDPIERPEGFVGRCNQHVLVYALADKCQLDHFKRLVLGEFVNDLAAREPHIWDILLAIEPVYTLIPRRDRMLRDCVVLFLTERPELTQLDLVQEILHGRNKLAYDLTVAWWDKAESFAYTQPPA